MFLLVPAYLGSPGQKAVKRLCVCVCVCVCVRVRVRACVCVSYELINRTNAQRSYDELCILIPRVKQTYRDKAA